MFSLCLPAFTRPEAQQFSQPPTLMHPILDAGVQPPKPLTVIFEAVRAEIDIGIGDSAKPAGEL